MRLLRHLLLIVIAVTCAVHAQISFAGLSTCSLTCIIQAVPAAGCTLTDRNCLCTSQGLRKNVANCLQANCTMADALDVAKSQATTCNLPKANKGHLIMVVTTTINAISAFAISLRFIGKRISGQRFTLDDYILGFSVLVLSANIYVVTSMINTGFGKHIYQLNHGDLLRILRYFYLGTILYVLNLGLIKFAMIIFYLRLFSYQRFRSAAWASLVFVSTSTLTIIFFAIFQCNPVEKYWNHDLRGKCLDLSAIAHAGAAVTISTDILIVVLPIPVISSLNLGWRKKIGVLAMFALGSLYVSQNSSSVISLIFQSGCVVSIIRLTTLVSYGDTVDPTYDLVIAVLWSGVEVPTALVCASFPALRRLFAIMLPCAFGSTLSSSKEHSKRSKSGHPQSWYATSSSFVTASPNVYRENDTRGDYAVRAPQELELERRPKGKERAVDKERNIGLAIGGDDKPVEKRGGMAGMTGNGSKRDGKKIPDYEQIAYQQDSRRFFDRGDLASLHSGRKIDDRDDIALQRDSRRMVERGDLTSYHSNNNSNQRRSASTSASRRSNPVILIRPLVIPDVSSVKSNAELVPEPLDTGRGPPNVPPKDEEYEAHRMSKRFSRLGLGWMSGTGGERGRGDGEEWSEALTFSKRRSDDAMVAKGVAEETWYESDSRSH